jgi:phenol 2-monooxygenase
MKKYSDISVSRGVLPESLSIDESIVEDPDAYPITVQLRHLTEEEAMPAQQKGSSVEDGLFRSNLVEDDTADLIGKSRENEGKVETIKAKYMIGCDGAHSWTRGQIGSELQGEPTDFIWGVLDIVPITDFRLFATTL